MAAENSGGTSKKKSLEKDSIKRIKGMDKNAMKHVKGGLAKKTDYK